jgi:hypothetical protein
MKELWALFEECRPLTTRRLPATGDQFLVQKCKFCAVFAKQVVIVDALNTSQHFDHTYA